MKTIPVVEHCVPLPVKHMMIVICERESSVPSMIIRKFKSRCGNTLEVHITRKSGFIRTIKALDTCQANCLDCYERIKMIRELVAREHQIA